MPRLEIPGTDLFPFLTPSEPVAADVKNDMIRLEQRMTAMLGSRSLPSFFKTPDEINADFYRKISGHKPEFINYSDTLDGCMNIQQSLLKNEGYMEENY
ncbi:MAG: hypothetical protein EOO05_10440 [Chitinophagaceae bacterium]|nr:MAG: hypothetical protein EOO05_10440 [Chitinophagaceae bacterium]